MDDKQKRYICTVANQIAYAEKCVKEVQNNRHDFIKYYEGDKNIMAEVHESYDKRIKSLEVRKDHLIYLLVKRVKEID